MGSDGQRGLSTAQARALHRLVHSRRTPPYLAGRAEIVLDEDRARTTGVARGAGVSRQTAGKWWRRYQELGPAGLEDAARPGRPPAAQDDTAHAVLTAPLFVNSPRWTSRTIAAAAGCTQSAVARTWKRTFTDGRTALGGALPAGALELEACLSGLDGSVLVLRSGRTAGPEPASAAGFMRSALRPALQTVLAADALSRRAARTGTAVEVFLREHIQRFGDATPGFALCTSASTATRLRELDPAISVIVVDRDSWQSLLLDLGPRLSPDAAESLSAVQRHAMEWAGTQDRPFVWIRDASEPGTGLRQRRESRSPAPAATTELVAESILSTLRHDIIAGRLGGGDRVTETFLARSAHASRGQVRDALRILASRGIVELQPNRGAVVPIPGADDVIETYAARRALGALIVRRAAESPLPGQLPRLEEALSTMLETARTGDAWATGEDDMRFQEVIAETTGMRRMPLMFSGLTAQLRIFVAVLGVRYAYSIPEMCQDDIALLQLIKDRDAAAAVNRWNTKMNKATIYMIQQLCPTKPYLR